MANYYLDENKGYLNVIEVGWQPGNADYAVQVFRAHDNGSGSPSTATELLLGTFPANVTSVIDHEVGGTTNNPPWEHYRARHISLTDTGISAGPYTGYIRAIPAKREFDPPVQYGKETGGQANESDASFLLADLGAQAPNINTVTRYTSTAAAVYAIGTAHDFIRAGAGNPENAISNLAIARTGSTAAVTRLIAYYGLATPDDGSTATVASNAIGFYAIPDAGSGQVGNWYGLYVGDPGGGGPPFTIANVQYGIYLGSIEWGSSNNYAIYSEGGPWRLGGGNFLLGAVTNSTSIHGAGARLMYMQNAVVPTGNPSSGGLLYVSSGALVFRGSSGTVTTIANA